MNVNIPTLKQCEEAIGIAVPNWAGQCYGIACMVNEAFPQLGGTPLYGHYHGEIRPGSIFYGRSGVVQHGWIKLPDGSVLDPTRWAFDSPDEPFLFHSTKHDDPVGELVCRHCQLTEDEHDGEHDDCGMFEGGVNRDAKHDYDEGGNQYALERMRVFGFPAYDGCRVEGFDPPLTEPMAMFIGDAERWSPGQVFWLASGPYDIVGVETYQYIMEHFDHGNAAIPTDNLKRLRREGHVAA